MRKLAIVGAESSGKTTLARDLAQALQAPWVAEYAREWFAGRPDVSYELQDIVTIAAGQLAAEAAAPVADWLVCDTSLLVTKIWAEVRFGHCPDWIARHWRPEDYFLHILPTPDIPWEYDPLREDSDGRPGLFERYRAALLADEVPFLIVRGGREARVAAVLAALETKIK
ncbi:AAA family ATPase [Chitinimonas lacunae]|uniref:AAA family ATPase n=1 Tax=Chitinimonas lacunae TaxID=1963018 RepID=A0ABV8MMB1_9NEIS